MSEDKVTSPHNNFFIQTFSRREAAESFFQNYLPSAMVEQIDWKSLQQENGSFIDAALGNRETDLLYTVKIGNTEAFIYVLFEHQSTEDAWMPWRMLVYMIRIWEQFRKKNLQATTLPMILPLVLYQGEREWKASTRFSVLIDFPQGQASIFSSQIPDFEHLLVSLPQLPEIRGNAYVIAALKLMQSIRGRALIHCIPEIETFLESIIDERGDTDFILACFRYTLQSETLDKQGLRHTFNTIRNPQLRNNAMTVADQLRAEGREEGISQGISKGIAQGISKGMAQGISKGELIGRILTLQEITGHAYIEPKKIADCSMEQLKETLKRLEADFAKQKK
jgi:predicted transposase/invertase (TIGR01784 family)